MEVDYKMTPKEQMGETFGEHCVAVRQTYFISKCMRKKTIIFKVQLRRVSLGETSQEKMKIIGDPITNTHWVDSWSHD